ncbi:hypothetical protein ZWY2020_020214 [Hordeum vulgare]|nr:hypothetical protein ZWY2020_020214 [Hordeum vulgare]
MNLGALEYRAMFVRGCLWRRRVHGSTVIRGLSRHGVHINLVFPMVCMSAEVLRVTDVSEAALFLASDQTGFLKSQYLVDEGTTTVIDHVVLRSVRV